MLEDLQDKPLDYLKEQIALAERVYNVLGSKEDRKTVYGFMVDVQGIIEDRLRAAS